MQPRLTSHKSEARSSITGKSMTLPERCSTAQVRIHGGRGDGARFMKKKSPVAPCGYRFITIALPATCGITAGATRS